MTLHNRPPRPATRGEGRGEGQFTCLPLLFFLSACATTVQGTYPGDRVMWDDILAHAEPLTLPGRPVAVVAPHHLIDATELAGFWTALAANKPSVVVVVAPDHYARGAGITVGRSVDYQTVYGTLRTDAFLARALEEPARDSAFVGEHSLHVHAPYVRKLLPEARFVPVMLQWATPRAELEALAKRLDALLPADALVVASVDFSHYQPAPWATFHDESAFSTVSGFDLDGLFLREVDSPESLFVAMRFAQLRGAQTATRLLHTNSQRRRSVFVKDSTSHQYFTFTPGPVVPAPSASVLITGDAPGLGFHEGWTWHPTRDMGAPKHEALKNLRGQEDRFFMGPEVTLFSLAPGEQVRRRINGLEVLLAGVDLSRPLPKLDGDCVVVLASRGALDLETARARARELSAQVVVGRGFGAELPLEEVDGRVVALSLGPFLPGLAAPLRSPTPSPQGAWPAVQGEGIPGRVLGVTCTKDSVRWRSVPVMVTNGVPSLDLEKTARELEHE